MGVVVLIVLFECSGVEKGLWGGTGLCEVCMYELYVLYGDMGEMMAVVENAVVS